MHGLHRSRDARLHIHALHGFEAAGEFIPQRHILLQDLGSRDRHGRRGSLRSGRFRV